MSDINFKKLLQKIDPSKTVFVVGNGINLYAERHKKKCEGCSEYDICKDENKSQTLGWKALLQKLCDKKKIPIDIASQNELSFPEIANLIDIEISKLNLVDSDEVGAEKQKMRQEISECFTAAKDPMPIHKKFLRFMQERNIPVITTNFDMLLSQNLHKHIIGSDDKSMFKSSPNYIWNYCYNDDQSVSEVSSLVNKFGVWHMHGNKDYPSSIKIGLTDYANAISRTKKMISGTGDKDKSQVNLYEAEDEKWVGKNTWLHSFFHRDIVFLGISLDSEEIFLRWLIMQRSYYQNYMKKKHKRPINKAWYVHADKCKLNKSTPKGIFFKACGIELVADNNFDDIYSWFK